jgi:hypothetical protein
MVKKFVWEKWVDPLNRDLDEVEFPGYGDPIIQDDEEDNIAYPVSHEETNKIHSIKPMQVLHTPMGLLTVTEHTLASKYFNFWILHTNFDIENIHMKIICETPGVETADVITRYKVRIGFPRSNLFNVIEVKQDIEERLKHPILNNNLIMDALLESKFGTDIVNQFIITRNEIIKEGEYWIIYILPSGKIIKYASDNKDTTTQKISFYRGIQQAVGGQVILYSDY